MLNLETNRGVRLCDGLNRREFLRVGGLAVGLSLTELAQLQQLGAVPRKTEKACIQLFLVGGPGQLDTWDMKPEAPEQVRGPFRPIPTNVPGIQICEHFPLMARLADRYAILRSIYHKESPIHETGHQLMQTGHLYQGGREWPHYGAVLSKLRPAPAEVPPWVLLPAPIGNTGVNVSHGQTAGFLGERHAPFRAPRSLLTQGVRLADRHSPHGLDPARLERPNGLVEAIDAAEREVEGELELANPQPAEEQAASVLFGSSTRAAFDLAGEPDSVRERYGWNTFGQSCLLARRLVEHGVHLVTVNMFDTVFGQITWDCHANGGDLNTTLDDYRDTLCPMLDQAYSALLEDLSRRGLLDTTLVLCMGEFGRTPRVNGRNGRDHWPGVWSGLVAGGGIRGGQVIGASTAHGDEPKDRPIHPSEIAATLYHALGIDLNTRLQGPDGRLLPLVSAAPVTELF